MFDLSRDVALDDPVESFCEQVEDVGCRAKPKYQYYVVVKIAEPVATYEITISMI